jgi:methanogenic corrinoid protein MtbC1
MEADPAESDKSARAYLAAIFRDDIAAAKRQVRDLVDSPSGLRHAYLEVFEPAQAEILRLLRSGELAPSRAHFLTMVSQELIEEFSSLVFEREALGVSALVCGPPGQLLDLGPRLIADLLDMEGFDTTFLGSSDSAVDIIARLRLKPFDLFVLYISGPSDLSASDQITAAIRTLGEQPRIIAGGPLDDDLPLLSDRLSIDAAFSDAEGAIVLARDLLNVNRIGGAA